MLENRIKLLSIAVAVAITFSLVSFYGGINIFADADSDGVPDSSDNCPDVSNPLQEDYDKDNLGDLCDPDDDNDKVLDEVDAFDTDPTEWSDFDSDKIGDNADIDDDNDGIVDAIDAFDTDPTEWADFDFDGIGANQDPDDDNDGILDIDDPTPVLSTRLLTEEYLDLIDDCAVMESGTFRLLCYKDFFGVLVYEVESNAEALDLAFTLAKLGAIDDCHFASHYMGHVAFEENPNAMENLFGIDSSVCRGGFYHGTLAAHFSLVKEQGKPISNSYKTLCDNLTGTVDYQDCVHGLGHGLVHYYLDDLKSSVDACHEMSFWQNSLCMGGVFMQYTDDELTKSTSLEEVVSDVCSRSELNSLAYQQCNVSLGLSLAYHTNHNLEVGSKFCKAILDEEGKGFCLRGLEEEIKDAESYKESPLTREQREKFQPQWVNSGSQIVDIRSPATISNFNYIPEIGLMTFSFDKPQYIILYIPEGVLPPRVVVSIDGEIPNDLVYENNFMGEGVTMMRLVPDNAGMVMIAPV